MSALSEKNSNEKRKIVVVQGRDIYEYRAFYKKFERAKYISHLDLYRAVQRTFQRADIPVWFTEGYNPHIYLTFPMPIFLGCEGVEESFDFRTTVDMEPEELMEKLNAAFPEGIRVTRMAAPVHKATEIARARYTLLVSSEGKTGEELRGLWEAFASSPEILAEKRTKKGMKTVDLKPMLFSSQAEAEGEALRLTLETACGIAENLSPVLLIDTFAAGNGCEADYRLIRRDGMYLEDGEAFC